LGEGTQVSIEVQRTCTLQVGDKSFDVKICGNPDDQQRAQNSPTLVPASDEARKRGESNRTLLFKPMGSECFYAYGAIAANRPEARAAYVKATGLLGAHWRDFFAQRRPKLQALMDKMCGYDVKSLYGQGYASLPASLQNSLHVFCLQYGQNGFSSSSDAQAWLSQATLTASSASAFLSVPGSSANSGIGLELP